ncbi:MAG: nickel pincer cofactor biosynthesis protein LarC [Acidimicrobiales bacterium]|nr:nickel pincer cofactor biosynthesis protein LarC [Acidimicrobiales bacterium]
MAWFHCFAGIAGDMALGALLDAGADLDEVRELLARVPIGGWRLDVEPVLRGGIAATRAVVTVTDHVVVRTYAHIVGIVEEARLPPRVTARALAIFAALAEVEGRLHRRPVEQVHFHEVGGHDAVIDIVGTAAALEVLGVDEVRGSPVATGRGMVRTAHGLLPNPAPAVVALLEGVPVSGRNLRVELTTPTGAAILAALSSGYGPMPPMRITAQGFGAGAREIEELPNCTQVVLGVSVAGAPSEASAGEAEAGQPVVLLETNVDDATGEQLAEAVAALLEAGALDAWLTPVIMKKGRPGSVVHVLSDVARGAELRRVLRRTTGTLGVRMTVAERWPAARAFDAVTIDDQLIRVKVSRDVVKAEHEDVVAAARRTGGTIRDLARRAEAQWLADQSRPADGRGATRVSGQRGEGSDDLKESARHVRGGSSRPGSGTSVDRRTEEPNRADGEPVVEIVRAPSPSLDPDEPEPA